MGDGLYDTHEATERDQIVPVDLHFSGVVVHGGDVHGPRRHRVVFPVRPLHPALALGERSVLVLPVAVALDDGKVDDLDRLVADQLQARIAGGEALPRRFTEPWHQYVAPAMSGLARKKALRRDSTLLRSIFRSLSLSS